DVPPSQSTGQVTRIRRSAPASRTFTHPVSNIHAPRLRHSPRSGIDVECPSVRHGVPECSTRGARVFDSRVALVPLRDHLTDALSGLRTRQPLRDADPRLHPQLG